MAKIWHKSPTKWSLIFNCGFFGNFGIPEIPEMIGVNPYNRQFLCLIPLNIKVLSLKSKN